MPSRSKEREGLSGVVGELRTFGSLLRPCFRDLSGEIAIGDLGPTLREGLTDREASVVLRRALRPLLAKGETCSGEPSSDGATLMPVAVREKRTRFIAAPSEIVCLVIVSLGFSFACTSCRHLKARRRRSMATRQGWRGVLTQRFSVFRTGVSAASTSSNSACQERWRQAARSLESPPCHPSTHSRNKTPTA